MRIPCLRCASSFRNPAYSCTCENAMVRGVVGVTSCRNHSFCYTCELKGVPLEKSHLLLHLRTLCRHCLHRNPTSCCTCRQMWLEPLYNLLESCCCTLWRLTRVAPWRRRRRPLVPPEADPAAWVRTATWLHDRSSDISTGYSLPPRPAMAADRDGPLHRCPHYNSCIYGVRLDRRLHEDEVGVSLRRKRISSCIYIKMSARRYVGDFKYNY